MQWYIGAFKKFAQFAGRARRKEFWMFALFNVIVAIIIGIIESVLGLATTSAANGTASFNGGPLSIIYSLAAIVPGLALGARRLHDIGKSGWLQLIALIPIVGVFILLYWFIKEGDAGQNKFGANPKTELVA